MTAATSHGSAIAERVAERAERMREGLEQLLADHRLGVLYLLPTLAVSAVVSFMNLDGAPQRIDAEGTTAAQVWSITRLGELSHYAYTYDRPPLGWLQIAAYSQLTGAFGHWDTAVLAVREAVVVASLVSVLLVFLLARRLGLRHPTAAVAALVFALAPLALQLHRTAYVDNVAVPWLLLAFLLALGPRRRAITAAGAALAFGVAVLTTEVALLLLPFLVWALVRSPWRGARGPSLVAGGATLLLIGGATVLPAALAGELFAAPGRATLAGGIQARFAEVAEWSSAGWAAVLDPSGPALRALAAAWELDPVVLALGVVAAGIAVVARTLRPIAVMVLALAVVMLLVPGIAVPVSVLVLLLPFATILMAGVVDLAVTMLQRRKRRWLPLAVATLAVSAAALVAAVPLWSTGLISLLSDDLDAPARDAEAWVEVNTARDARLLVDDGMWVDLLRDGRDRADVVWFAKFDTDAAVQAQSPGGWRDVDYVVSTEALRATPASSVQVRRAIVNSVVVASFGSGAQAVEVRRVVPQGVAQAEAQAQAAAEQRLDLGEQLARNPGLVLSDTAREQLLAGEVDARIAIALGAQLAVSSVEVTAFPAVPGESTDVRRTVAIAALDGEPVVERRDPSAAARAFVDTLQGPYSPSTTISGDSGRRLLITFPLVVTDTTSD